MRLFILVCVLFLFVQAEAQRARGRALRRFDPNPVAEAEVIPEESPIEPETKVVAEAPRSRAQRPRLPRFRGRTQAPVIKEEIDETKPDIPAPSPPVGSGSRRRLRIPQKPRTFVPPTPVAVLEEMPVKPEPVEDEMEMMPKEVLEEKEIMEEIMEEKIPQIQETPIEETPQTVPQILIKPVIKPLPIRLSPRRRTETPSKSPKQTEIIQPDEVVEEAAAPKSTSHRFSSSPRIRGRTGSPSRGRSAPKTEEGPIIKEETPQPIESQSKPSRRRLRPLRRSRPTPVIEENVEEEPLVQIEEVQDNLEPVVEPQRSSSTTPPSTTEKNAMLEISDIRLLSTTSEATTEPSSKMLSDAPISTTEKDFLLSFFDEISTNNDTKDPDAQYEYIIYEYYDDEPVEDSAAVQSQTKSHSVITTSKPTTTKKPTTQQTITIPTTESTTTTTTTSRPTTERFVATEAPSSQPRIRIVGGRKRKQKQRGDSISPRWELVGTVEDTPPRELEEILSGLGSRRRGLSKPPKSRLRQQRLQTIPEQTNPVDDQYLFEDYETF